MCMEYVIMKNGLPISGKPSKIFVYNYIPFFPNYQIKLAIKE